jgi:hypothetical protein
LPEHGLAFFVVVVVGASVTALVVGSIVAIALVHSFPSNKAVHMQTNPFGCNAVQIPPF